MAVQVLIMVAKRYPLSQQFRSNHSPFPTNLPQITPKTRLRADKADIFL